MNDFRTVELNIAHRNLVWIHCSFRNPVLISVNKGKYRFILKLYQGWIKLQHTRRVKNCPLQIGDLKYTFYYQVSFNSIFHFHIAHYYTLFTPPPPPINWAYEWVISELRQASVSSAKPLKWKWLFILIFTREVLHYSRFESESFWISEIAYCFQLLLSTTVVPRESAKQCFC